MTDLDHKLDDAAEAITNAFYLSVQEQIGQDDGGIASIFESGGMFKDEIARPIVTQLIGNDHSDESFAKFENIFDYKFITSQIDKRWKRPSDVNLDNGEDLEAISKNTVEVLNKAIQKEFPDYPGINSELALSLGEVTSSYVKLENSYDEDAEPAAPSM
ncbi:hypothetical protein [Mesorhizobium sp. SP-1A]|uniref:hypothetical protein n=1 Tax=Mesorhizobium sp. SP-1A TaxID=3077840 RepID=UPI0028F6D10A|nr:hypothetical protein [Mesorhizobium sp. SP-1A]